MRVKFMNASLILTQFDGSQLLNDYATEYQSVPPQLLDTKGLEGTGHIISGSVNMITYTSIAVNIVLSCSL